MTRQSGSCAQWKSLAFRRYLDIQQLGCLKRCGNSTGAPDIGEALRLEVKRRSTGLHVKRHRDMLMRDQPLAVNLAAANGRAHPHIDSPSVRLRAAEPVEAMAEGHIIARRDAQVANLAANRALERRNPLLRASSRRI